MTEGIIIRPANSSERARCITWWQRSVFGRIPLSEDGHAWTKFGRSEVRADLAYASVGEMLYTLSMPAAFDVAVMGDEPLGFVSWHDPTPVQVTNPVCPMFQLQLHYIFVTGEARRKGLGTMLFRHAVNRDYIPTFMTRAGRALEQHALRLIAAERGHDERQESNVVAQP